MTELFCSSKSSDLLFKDIEIKHNLSKRLFDICFSLGVLILASPLYLFIALLVFFSSKGGIFYGHQRIGRGGKKFNCYKFRTMHKDASWRLKELLASDPILQAEWDRSFKLKNDPRITEVGAFLRKTSLDEIPQFWNVLRGDLSLVGPRPLVQEEIEKYLGAKASYILSVRPGLTGIWQTSGRNDTSYEARIAMDESYIASQSFFLDLKLILKTIPCMLLRKGAY